MMMLMLHDSDEKQLPSTFGEVIQQLKNTKISRKFSVNIRIALHLMSDNTLLIHYHHSLLNITIKCTTSTILKN